MYANLFVFLSPIHITYYVICMCTKVSFAAAWPCGTITVLEELFKAEAKSQVYASIHSFVYTNPETTGDMSKYISCCQIIYKYCTLSNLGFLVYDDACQLKKFAINPIRCSLTKTAERIVSMILAVDKMHYRGHTDKW